MTEKTTLLELESILEEIQSTGDWTELDKALDIIRDRIIETT